MKEKFFIDAFEEYRKRLQAYCRFNLIEIQEQHFPAEQAEKMIETGLEREALEIEKAIPQGAVFIPLCIEGKELSSTALADRISAWASGGKSKLCFLIGGSNGIAGRIKNKADFRLSMSPMTFPHHLARVMLAEQIYRAFTIIEGTKYHK